MRTEALSSDSNRIGADEVAIGESEEDVYPIDSRIIEAQPVQA